MKTIGLIGGTSWESTLEYYRIINQTTRERLGANNSAKIVMYSLNFEDVKSLISSNKFDDLARLVTDAAQKVEKGGADFLLICANTMHLLSGEIQKHIAIPILHIADATSQKIKEAGVKQAGLLGTKFTMEQNFLIYKFKANDISIIVPEEHERNFIQKKIFEELMFGKIEAGTKMSFLNIIDGLAARSAQGVILGCTEIPLLIKQKDTNVVLFDTTEIHARAAVEYALDHNTR